MIRWNAVIAFTLLASLGSVAAVCAAPFSIPRWSIDGGGMGLAQLGTLIAGGTIGQPDAARLRTGYTVVYSGFWQPDGPVPSDVPIDPPPPGPENLRDEIFATTPNPFAGTTRVAFSRSAPGRVEARVFDVRGALVRTLAAGEMGAGLHVQPWDGCDDSGSRLSPGVYLLRVRIPALRSVQKLVILR